jgi:murein DD-endopeptidase MepM/ murein hydrolase activator NlpD
VDSRPEIRLKLIGKLFAVALAAWLIVPAGALAATGGAPTPAGGPPPPPSPTGASSEAPNSGALSLLAAKTSPRKSYYYGFRYPSLRFTVGSTQSQNDLRIDVVDTAGQVVRTFYRNDAAPNVEIRIRWDGTTSEGRPAPNGRYSFRVSAQGTARTAPRATAASEPISLSFEMFRFAFPVLGAHDFGSAGGRFGAARSGHTHQGQDVMADCGLPLVAARGGRVQYSGFEGNAGNYVVIDGKGTSLDFMYAHMAEPSPLKTGDLVRTGQPIGIVGDTGDATACHLHFEIWTAPGWYEGGAARDPKPDLERWAAS